MPECVVCGQVFDQQSRLGRPSVTCSPDCRRIRNNRLSKQSRQRAADRGCPDDMHGTQTGYSHYRCGCPECSRWSRLYQQRRRKALNN